MLSFAAKVAPAKAGDGALSSLPSSPPSSLHARDFYTGDVAPSHSAPPHASSPSQAHYWPCELLNAFILKMAATGHCVNAAMMLGHRSYAQEQLALAEAAQDDSLRAMAARLQVYFEVSAPEACAVVAEIDGP